MKSKRAAVCLGDMLSEHRRIDFNFLINHVLSVLTTDTFIINKKNIERYRSNLNTKHIKRGLPNRQTLPTLRDPNGTNNHRNDNFSANKKKMFNFII